MKNHCITGIASIFVCGTMIMGLTGCGTESDINSVLNSMMSESSTESNYDLWGYNSSETYTDSQENEYTSEDSESEWYTEPEVSTELNTESSTEPSTEPGTESSNTEDYASVYIKVLRDNWGLISNYDQYRFALGAGQYSTEIEDEADDKPIAIQDITGDGIPELIFVGIKYDDNGNYQYMGDLYIYTVDGGEAKQIYYENRWDNKVAGGNTYSLFQIEGDTALYECSGMADEFYDEKYSRYDLQSDGTLKKTEIMDRYHYLDYDSDGNPGEMIVKCTMNGSEISESDFQSELDKLSDNMTKLLMYNHDAYDSNAANAMASAQQCYLTYEEALLSLYDVDINSGTAVFPFRESQAMYFSSGAGGWSSDLTLERDGSFVGYYSDGELGSTGDGYEDGTYYVCTFHGAFSNVKKIDEYTYSMELDSLENMEKESEWLDESNGYKYRYVASGANGIYGGTTFYLYMPGTSVSNLPQQIQDFYGYQGLDDETTLPCCVLYNADEDCGFCGKLLFR